MFVVKTKALISFAVTAKLICALFLPMQIVGFPMQRLIYVAKVPISILLKRFIHVRTGSASSIL